jgi:tetratricopeptide (TPR) repeat protein
MTEDEESSKPELSLELQRFEEMLNKGDQAYFDPEVFEEIIDYYIGQHDYKKALRALDMALSQHPFSTSLMLLKAELYVSTGKLLKAQEILNKLEQLEPYNPDVYMLKASIYSQQRIFEESVRYLKKAIRYSDEDDLDDLYIDLAVEYENCEKFDKAIECLKHALKRNPENETALYEISYCYELADRNNEAMEFYKNFIDANPYSYLAWHHLGTAYIKDGRLDDSLEAFDYCLAVKDSFSTAYFNKATVLMMKEEYGEAIEYFNETVLRGEAIALTYLYLGECYERLGEDILAEQNLQRALELEDEMPDIYFALGMLKNKMNHYVEAEFYAKQAIQMDEANPDYWYLLAEIYENAGNPESASDAYAKSVELSENGIDIILDYSNFKFNQENVQSAIDFLHEMLVNNKPVAAVLYRLAVYYFIQGKKAEAYSYFEEALTADVNVYTQAFEYWPEMAEDKHLIQLVDAYRNN